MFNLSGLAFTQECREGIGPSLDVGKTAKDRLNILESGSILVLVGPVEFNNFGTFFFQDFGALFSKGSRVAIIAITFPLFVSKRKACQVRYGSQRRMSIHVLGLQVTTYDTDANILVSSFQKGDSNTVSEDTSTGRDTKNKQQRVFC